jgi:hypothetical protein
MIDKPNPHHVRWCKRLFDGLKDGAIWGVPRSGMIFRRHGDKLVWEEQMPHMADMPISATQLEEQQEREFESISAHFGAAGIKVLKSIRLM